MSIFDFSPSFWEHVEQLRKTAIKCMIAVCLATTAAFICFDWFYPLITAPLKPQSSLTKTFVIKERLSNHLPASKTLKKPSGRIIYYSENTDFTEDGLVTLPPKGIIEWESEKDQTNLVLLGPMEGMISSLKISFWVGLFLASPFCGFFILQFISPALHRNEKAFALPFAVFSLLFLFSGAFFAFTITIPFSNQILSRYNQNLGVNLWTVSHYLNYTLIMVLSTSIAFELALILLFLVHYGKISGETLKRLRPVSYVGAFVLSALLTPPDIFTQICLATPMMVIYEISIIYAKLRRHLLKRRNSAVII